MQPFDMLCCADKLAHAHQGEGGMPMWLPRSRIMHLSLRAISLNTSSNACHRYVLNVAALALQLLLTVVVDIVSAAHEIAFPLITKYSCM